MSEAEDIGTEDYFYSGALCFIEWPEKIDELLPGDVVDVTISENPDGSRTVEVKYVYGSFRILYLILVYRFGIVLNRSGDL